MTRETSKGYEVAQFENEEAVVEDGGPVGGEETYEGVTAEQFEQFAARIDEAIELQEATSVILVFALFLSAGAIVVQTLVDSLRG